MRNLAETVHIRLAAVEEMAVRQVLAVRAADRRWVSTVVGRRGARRMTSPAAAADGRRRGGPAEGMPYADFVENRLHDLVDGRARPRPASGPARRSSWPCPTPYAVSRRGCRSG